MSRYINLFLLGFIVFWLDDRLTGADKIAIRDKWESAFNDTSKVSIQDLPRYEYIPNTNITGRIIVVNEKQLENLKVDLSNVTVAKFNTWRASNISNTNYFRIARGEDWESIVAGYNLRLITNAVNQ
jgi:uncharacterized protein YqfB (UPF0267 family)